MKLIRLRSIANNAVRSSIWTPEAIGIYPFEHIRPKETIIVDLIRGELTPAFEGDDVEKYYQAMSKWLHQVLAKEGIPLDVIDSATIIITPQYTQCTIIAHGKSFESKKISF
jgi:hypothetical protein